MNVLLLNDNPEEAGLIRDLLNAYIDEPIEIEWERELIDAIKRLDEHDFDIALMNLGEPDGDGLERFILLLNANPTIPFVVLTDLADKQRTREALRWGAKDYVLKSEM